MYGAYTCKPMNSALKMNLKDEMRKAKPASASNKSNVGFKYMQTKF